jgi:tRNA-splicing ligase RtcB
VEEVRDERAAAAFGLAPGTVTVLLHSGSRGLGYQVCDDALGAMHEGARRHRIALPDAQLVAVPISSPEGKRYLAAMRAAANFAWANRQVMMALIERFLLRIFGGNRKTLGFRLVYDVAHNIAKLEEHEWGGKHQRVLVHRKGATRAFPAGHPEVPRAYREVGQPVLVPGDMGRASFVCVGTDKAMAETFGSAAHGAGRMMSPRPPRRGGVTSRVVEQRAAGGPLANPEVPEAYKDAAGRVLGSQNRAPRGAPAPARRGRG